MNDLIPMKNGENDSLISSDLLTPRKNLPWRDDAMMLNCWMRPFLIDNQITRAHANSIIEEEKEERTVLRDAVEGELVRLSSDRRRFWMSEYRFIEKLLTFRQLVVYAPSFLSLARIMPKKLITCRRMVVQEFLEQYSLEETPFVSKLCRQFVRSSVLLYPAERLMEAGEKFARLATRSADQSVKVNRRRVAMQIRALHLLSDQEICDQFRHEETYLSEIVLLNRLARHYHLSIDDIFRITAIEVSRFWEMQNLQESTAV